MEYKRIFRSQQSRFMLMRLLSWIPNSMMLRMQYRIKMGFWPDFKSPNRFTEKIQLYKMHYRNPIMHQCVDKYDVRNYIESKGLGVILNTMYGVYEKPEDIDFSVLPKQFVIKKTTGGGGQNVIIIKDKYDICFEELQKELNLWCGSNDIGARAGREWAYYNCSPRIIIEQLLVDNNQLGGLNDYKFFCFNGHVHCVQVDSGRFDSHKQNFYDIQGKSLGVHCTYPEGEVIDMPSTFGLMKKIAEHLSQSFPFVRVDLYDVNGVVYFGELTFYPSSGYGRFHPDCFDFELGSVFTEY